MKVYVVIAGTYSDYGYYGVFSSREKAQKYIDDTVAPDQRGEYSIDEHDLDPQYEQVEWVKCYCARIYLDDGKIEPLDDEDFYWAKRTDMRRGSVTCHGETRFNGFSSRGVVSASSFVSPEHAAKLAVEARQRYLREFASERYKFFAAEELES